MRAFSPSSSVQPTTGGQRCVPLAELTVGVPARLDRTLLPACDVAFLAAIGLGRGCILRVRAEIVRKSVEENRDLARTQQEDHRGQRDDASQIRSLKTG